MTKAEMTQALAYTILNARKQARKEILEIIRNKFTCVFVYPMLKKEIENWRVE